MKTQENPSVITQPTSVNEPRWPENSPSVAMDIALGQQGKPVDFDIESYNQILDRAGIGDERRDLSITFKDGKALGTTVDTIGRFLDDTQHIDVAAGRRDRIVNKYLMHETGHFIQSVHDELPTARETVKGHEKRARILRFALPIGYFAVGSTLIKLGDLTGGNISTGIVDLAGELSKLGGIFGTVGAITGALAGDRPRSPRANYFAYSMASHERGARKYARQQKNESVFSRRKSG